MSSNKKETLRDWIVLFLCSSIYFLQAGFQRAGALTFVACMDRYNVNREKASIPFIVNTIISTISGPLFGYLGTRLQLRTIVTVGNVLAAAGTIANFWAEDVIFLTFFGGIIGGLGIGASYALVLEFLNRHFDKHLLTAYGIYFAGASIGATVIPYLFNYLLDCYGLSGTFLILGGLNLNTIPASLALPVYPKISNPKHDSQQLDIQYAETEYKDSYSTGKNIFSIEQLSRIVDKEDKAEHNGVLRTIFWRGCAMINKNYKIKEKSTDISVVSSFRIVLSPIFIVLAIIRSCLTSVIVPINVILVDYCFEKGVTSHQGVYIVMAVSITDIVGRIGLGWITDYGFIGLVNFLGGSYVLFGISCWMYIWSNGFIMCILCSVLFGAMYGVVISFSPKLFKDFIEPKDRTMAVASRNVFFIPVAIAMPSILGYFKDTVKSYDGLMYIFGVLCLLAAVLTFAVPHLVKRQLKSNIQSLDQNEQRF